MGSCPWPWATAQSQTLRMIVYTFPSSLGTCPSFMFGTLQNTYFDLYISAAGRPKSASRQIKWQVRKSSFPYRIFVTCLTFPFLALRPNYA